MQSLFAIAFALAMVNVVMSVTCPYPYTAVGSGCYTLAPQVPVSWEEAYQNCILNWFGYLVEIESAAEQDDVAAYLYGIDNQYQDFYWIGLSDIQEEGIYRWMNSGNYMSYSNWVDGEPSVATNDDCAMMITSELRQWQMYPCTTEYSQIRAICEADPI